MNTAVVAVAVTVALAIMLLALLARYFWPSAVSPSAIIADKYHRPAGDSQPLKNVLLAAGVLFIASRLLIAVIAAQNAVATGDWSRLNILNWIKWDANHYVGLAENWYVNEGDPRFHIVFFPLYPAILRVGKLLFGWDARIFGIVLSNVCLVVSAVALYRLAEQEYGSARAGISMRLFMFSPVTFFYSLPFSESLFFMLTVLAVLMAHRKKFAWALFLGALAAFTRMLGLLCAVAIFYEMIRERDDLRAGDYIKSAALTCVVASGFLAYLILNYAVTGSPFTFFQYQREHWSQTMGSVGNTIKYTLDNALHYEDLNLRLGTWIPQSLTIIGCIALLCLSFRRISPADGAYALLYIWFSLSPTWLLSGTRYISAMYPIYFMAAAVTGGRKGQFAAMTVSIVMLTYMVALYLSGSVM